jgi:Sigma-70 factor, region 1.2
VESFSRGLVDTYFRQMGEAAWLSREEEIALSQRIEASQQAMLVALCRVPVFVERIGHWGRQVVGGQFRLADLFDLSLVGSEADSPDQARDGDTETVDAEAVGCETASNEDAGEASSTMARLQGVIALVDEVNHSVEGGFWRSAAAANWASATVTDCMNSRPGLLAKWQPSGCTPIVLPT